MKPSLTNEMESLLIKHGLASVVEGLIAALRSPQVGFSYKGILARTSLKDLIFLLQRLEAEK